MNGRLVSVKADKAFSMVKNMLIPYIEVNESKNKNLHHSKVMNIEWVLKNTVKRKPRIFYIAKMSVKYFLKHGLPFIYNLDTRMPEKVCMIKMKCTYQRFGLGFRPRKKDYKGLLN